MFHVKLVESSVIKAANFKAATKLKNIRNRFRPSTDVMIWDGPKCRVPVAVFIMKALLCYPRLRCEKLTFVVELSFALFSMKVQNGFNLRCLRVLWENLALNCQLCNFILPTSFIDTQRDVSTISFGREFQRNIILFNCKNLYAQN